METAITNATQLPLKYYGLHMVEGVAEYKKEAETPYRIFIGQDTINEMNPSFTCKPVYVRHVEAIDLAKLQEEADGYVVRSFYNKSDGKTWAEFLVVSDEGHNAIRQGWKLSNAYIPKEMAGGGLWHGVDYSKEVVKGEYEHLAIVPDPRYAESVILTPEGFKEYNLQKDLELSRLSNSLKKEEKSMLNFFKKTKVENSAAVEFEALTVVLPKSKRELTLTQIINEMDKDPKEAEYAKGDHKVKVGEKEMTVNELVDKHMKLCDAMDVMTKGSDDKDQEKGGEPKLNEDKMDAPKKNDDDEMMDSMKKNAEPMSMDVKKSDAVPAPVDSKKSNSMWFDDLKSAPFRNQMNQPVVELSEDKVARGKSRYGS